MKLSHSLTTSLSCYHWLVIYLGKTSHFQRSCVSGQKYFLLLLVSQDSGISRSVSRIVSSVQDISVPPVDPHRIEVYHCSYSVIRQDCSFLRSTNSVQIVFEFFRFLFQVFPLLLYFPLRNRSYFLFDSVVFPFRNQFFHLLSSLLPALFFLFEVSLSQKRDFLPFRNRCE